MANRLLVVATVGTRLTRPRFRHEFEADTVLFTDAHETFDEPVEPPEVVRFLVYLTSAFSARRLVRPSRRHALVP